MSTQTTAPSSQLPDYLASAKPNPPIEPGALVQEHRADLRGDLPLVRVLGFDLPVWADQCRAAGDRWSESCWAD